jgi:phage replication O-like protein O
MANPQVERGYVRIANELLEAFSRLTLPVSVSCLFVILRYTYGYNRKKATIDMETFTRITHLEPRSVRMGLAWLVKRNIILWNKNDFEIQKNFDMWKGVRNECGKLVDNSSAQLEQSSAPLEHSGVLGFSTPFTLLGGKTIKIKDKKIMGAEDVDIQIPDRLLKIPRFTETYLDWLAFRAYELRKPVTPRAVKKQLEFLENQPDPVECINQAIRNQWQGIYPAKNVFTRDDPKAQKPDQGRRVLYRCKSCQELFRLTEIFEHWERFPDHKTVTYQDELIPQRQKTEPKSLHDLMEEL